MKRVNWLKIAPACVLICGLTMFDGYLYWIIGLSFDMNLNELVFRRIGPGHAIEASIIAYAIVFPATVIAVSRIFRLGKIGVKYVLASALLLSLLRFILLVIGWMRTLNPIGYTTSIIVLASVCYLMLRFYTKTLPDGMTQGLGRSSAP